MDHAIASVLSHLIILKLVVSCGLGGLIGLEREYRQKTAGFRTHMLVALGSTMFTLLSASSFFWNADHSRVAAQIVSGIGFIGAGAIMRQGLSVRGLTTASTLWLVASIGMAVGCGWYVEAVTGTLLGLLALIVLSNVERYLPAWPTPVRVNLRLGIDAVLLETLRTMLADGGWEVRRGQMERQAADRLRVSYQMQRAASSIEDLLMLVARLEAMPGVHELAWEMLEAN
ncbi:MAG TPA: MgtC/SapB family protein [Oscillatoriaceae cyanobacterium]